MEEEGTICITPQFKHVPNELIHRIQSLLPEKDAARSCVLSKSWLHAWSTIPTLRFTTCVTDDHLTEREEINYMKLIDRTLLRYLNDNMSIECFHLHLDIEKLYFPSPVENCFQVLASRNCLNDLSLRICGKKLVRNPNEAAWLTIPDAIFSCQNLNTIRLRADDIGLDEVRMNTNPVIKCSYLRVLELLDVCISEGALQNLFSSCSLLEKIAILFPQYLETIKVKNMRYLSVLQLKVRGDFDNILEIYDVPSLRLISYSCLSRFTIRMDTLRSVRELRLFRTIVDDAFIDMIISKFPFLEMLELTMTDCMLETLKITCASLLRVTLECFSHKQINIHIYALKLLSFTYEGLKMPSLLFPSTTPAHIELILCLREPHPIDLSFFVKLREALDLSSNFNIEVEENFVPLDIDLDELRRMFPFPARNVQQLSFGKHFVKELWKCSPLLDFLFSICYPSYVKTYYKSSNGKNYWYKQMVQMMEKKARDLKDIEIKNPCDGKWESLTDYLESQGHNLTIENYEEKVTDPVLFECPWRSFIDDDGNEYTSDEFKLNWLP